MRSEHGYPILFSNGYIRQMMKLAKIGRNDIFYDLGSGWGQNVLVALTEFRVKKAIGIEGEGDRWKKSNQRLQRWKRHYAPQQLNARFIKANFNDFFFDGKQVPVIDGATLKEATVVFYGLGTVRKLAKQFGQTLTNGCKLIYYYDCLFPEFLPTKIAFPFFLSKFPFTKPKSKIQWLKIVTGKASSSYRGKKQPQEAELWDELAHDYGWENDRTQIKTYQKRLESTTSSQPV